MKLTALILAILCSFSTIFAQNVGIGTLTPTEKLEVNGNIKAIALTLTTGGTEYDFLMKTTSGGQVGFRKAHGAVGIHYIIALDGTFPTQSGTNYNVTLVGEIKLFTGNFAPGGWAFCNGQMIAVGDFAALFALLGTTYGGDGQDTFALPDLRGAVPVSPGIAPAGYEWSLGEKSN